MAEISVIVCDVCQKEKPILVQATLTIRNRYGPADQDIYHKEAQVCFDCLKEGRVR